MKTEQNICSRLWTDLNIDFTRNNIRRCCKSTNDYIIPLEEVIDKKEDVFTFYNINEAARKSMVVDNKIPWSCVHCIKDEPNSIRQVYNIWTDDVIDSVKDSLLQDTTKTTYVEFVLGNQCDLACVYCGPWSSTTWSTELGHDTKKIQVDTEWRTNVLQYIKSYIAQLPIDAEITINILGGEPLIMPELYDVIDALKESASKFTTKPILMITTNLNAKPKLMSRFINLVNTNTHFKWVLGVSIEDIDTRATMVRYNLNWNRFVDNIKQIQATHANIYFTATVSLFSLPYFDEFIKWMFTIMDPTEYGDTWRITMNDVNDGYSDVAYLLPEQVDIESILNSYQSLLQKYNISFPHDDILQSQVDAVTVHLENLYTRVGTKIPTNEFFEYWTTMSARRTYDYMTFGPIKYLYDKYLYERHNKK